LPSRRSSLFYRRRLPIRRRYERERVAVGSRARPHHGSLFIAVLPFNIGQPWQEVANDAEGPFLAACYAPNGGLSGKRRRDRRQARSSPTTRPAPEPSKKD
jgi:hypothetical protein